MALTFNKYETNLGMCFIFQDENEKLIFVSSDMKETYEKIFSIDSDSEIIVGRNIPILGTRYIVTNIHGYSDLQRSSSYEEDMVGKKYVYSYILKITVKKA